MKYAADFRKIARDALFGRWHIAAITCFLASLIGANIGSSAASGSVSQENDSNFELGDYLDYDLASFILLIAAVLSFVLLLYWVTVFIIGGAGKLGYARYNLELIDGKEAKICDLFSQFHRIGQGFVMNFLQNLYIFLWSLLFVIPGIVKSYSYAMTPYILYEHPEYTANQAITESRRMMSGNKWRLFCLSISFIGWQLLCALPLLVGVLFLLMGRFWLLMLIPFSLLTAIAELVVNAYREAAWAAFYRDISQVPETTVEN